MSGPDAVASFLADDERFEVLRAVGSGGMGVVYEALDRERGVRVALKTLPRLDGEALRRFKREFRAVQGIRHPNLVELGELIERSGTWFITMELVRGVDFLAYVRGASARSAPSVSSSSAESPTTILEDSVASQRRVRASLEVPDAPPPVDEVRLRHALAQLSRGLMALHAANKVHRDIKPSNVLVTDSGHVKILDFGLVADTERERDAVPEQGVVGTPNYMAPEQALGTPAGPAADWYSVGVALYVALTGAPPFVGASDDVLVKKQLDEAPPPSSRVPEVAPELDELCARLLVRDPTKRATGRDVLALLEGDTGGAIAPIEGFVGREEELALLQAALEESRTRQVTVLVAGESGVGKSALVARFAQSLRLGRRARRPPVVLHGRCYEREAVPYKAFDGVVDALGDHLATLPISVQRDLLPEDAALLARIFPVLERVPAIGPQTAPSARVAPQMLRTRVFAALRALLSNMAQRAPIAVLIDDLQWSDADSLALLRDVLRAPEAPRVLLLATLRLGPGADAAAAALPGAPRRVELTGLPLERARELAAQLLVGFETSDERDLAGAAAIAEESGGHPLFLAELARHARGPQASQRSAPPRLEDVIADRLARLDASASVLLATLSIASAPLTFAQVARATGAGLEELGTRISALRAERLVTTTGARRGDFVEPYHDRVRASAVALLSDDERAACHARLAGALEAERPDDHEALATHWAAAGDAARAMRHAVLAGERASASLAFNQAAELYRMAIALAPRTPDPAAARRLSADLGRVLSWAGHGLEAARAYRTAAEGADPSASLELRRRAAEQLLSTGHFDEGLGELRGVLASAGLAYPEGRAAAIASLLLERARVRVRGLSFRAREEHEVPARDLARVDVCWAAVVGLSMMDTARGAHYQAQNLRLSLDAGEPYRVCRALAWEGAMETALGSYERSASLAEAARALAARLDDPPQLRALIQACAATAAYLSGRWREVRRLLAEVEELSRVEWSDEARYEIDNVRMMANASLTYLGEVGAYFEDYGALVTEARERRNVHILTNLQSGMNVLNFLARGLHAEAGERLDEAISFWTSSRVHIPHFVDLYGRVQLALYEGDGAAALSLVSTTRPQLARALLLHGPYFRLNVRDLAGRAAIAAASRAAGTKERAELLGAAEREARGLEGEVLSAWATPLAATLRAGIAAVRGDRGLVEGALRAAAVGFEAADMGLAASAVKRRLGVVVGGDEGRSLVAEAEAWMTSRTVTKVDEVTAILAPGFD